MPQCFHTVKELREYLKPLKAQGKTVGLVPTMGALHQGHATLISNSAKENDITVVSVFVNPTQFGPTEDFDAYPRTLEADLEVVGKAGGDVVFAPSPAEMYPSSDDTWVEVTGNITKVLCGKSRPIHFRGVTTVVSKLFNIVGPTRAYFGQKDAQQVEVLRRMVKDMFFDLELRIVPIVREESGLARSSRNTYLSAEEKSAAVILSKTLKSALDKFKSGTTKVEDIISFTRNEIAKEPLANIEYVECYGLPGLYELSDEVKAPSLLAVAVRFGTTRLIDNIILE
ncbi:pantoate--beta-alanine ligase [Succinivibrio dextrinosolvens]|uniref:pantoate--beta-alanine ligase n=1 Tax=Succinivibrio dextrinosolvens TaxID=83771 RepID=UPI00241DDD9F|nr:pantoate--beta-alanine ligase [Succinivibrio dextrinosolvens]MBE6423162.1 pantoate--beta-alanine ligase [Succinivibrio dextrinosolvens]